VAARDDNAGMTNARSERAPAPARFARANAAITPAADTFQLPDQPSIYAVFFGRVMTPVTSVIRGALALTEGLALETPIVTGYRSGLVKP
jgi:hypothetical protein